MSELKIVDESFKPSDNDDFKFKTIDATLRTSAEVETIKKVVDHFRDADFKSLIERAVTAYEKQPYNTYKLVEQDEHRTNKAAVHKLDEISYMIAEINTARERLDFGVKSEREQFNELIEKLLAMEI